MVGQPRDFYRHAFMCTCRHAERERFVYVVKTYFSIKLMTGNCSADFSTILPLTVTFFHSIPPPSRAGREGRDRQLWFSVSWQIEKLCKKSVPLFFTFCTKCSFIKNHIRYLNKNVNLPLVCFNNAILFNFV